MVECRDFFIMKSKVFSMLKSKCVTLGAKLLYIKKYSQSLAETKGKGYTIDFPPARCQRKVESGRSLVYESMITTVPQRKCSYNCFWSGQILQTLEARSIQSQAFTPGFNYVLTPKASVTLFGKVRVYFYLFFAGLDTMLKLWSKGSSIQVAIWKRCFMVVLCHL